MSRRLVLTLTLVNVALTLANLVFAAKAGAVVLGAGSEETPRASGGTFPVSVVDPAPAAEPVPITVAPSVTSTTTTTVPRRRRPLPAQTGNVPQAPAGPKRTVESTAYCFTGTMANGRPVQPGAAAMNGVPFGTQWRVLDGPYAGRVVTVMDRYGHGTEFDVWVSDCGAAKAYGRRTVTIERVN